MNCTIWPKFEAVRILCMSLIPASLKKLKLKPQGAMPLKILNMGILALKGESQLDELCNLD